MLSSKQCRCARCRGIVEKECSQCKHVLPVADFVAYYSSNVMCGRRLSSQCKQCCALRARGRTYRWPKNRRNEKSGNQERRKVRRQAGIAVQHGTILRGPCGICNASRAEMHHDNYDNPLDVRWLCRSCHARLHRKYA